MDMQSMCIRESSKCIIPQCRRSDESFHNAEDHLCPNLDGTQKKEMHEIPLIMADVEAVINRLEKEVTQNYEDTKSAIKSKKYFKLITQGKQQIIQKLEEASRLLSKISDELLSAQNQKSQGTIMTPKRNTLMAEREAQWIKHEEILFEEFKEKRKQELIEIENEWTERWKGEMEEKWSTIELYLKEHQPEIEMDAQKKQFIDKFTSDSFLKWEGMTNMWEMRNNNEWTAHRLISKSQWDNESDQLWTAVSKADIVINTDFKQTNEILDNCKIQIENILKSSTAMMKITNKTSLITGKLTSKVVEGCKEFHQLISSVYLTIQQDEDLKALQKASTAARKEIKQKTLMKSEDPKRDDQELTQELIKSEQVQDLTLELKEAIDEREKIKTRFLGELQGLDLKWKQEQASWQSHKRSIDRQSDTNQRKFTYDTNVKQQPYKCEALIESKHRLNKFVEELKAESDEIVQLGESTAENQRNKPKMSTNYNYNRQLSNIPQGNATSNWMCEWCAMDNPLNKHICDVCDKPNDKLKERLTLDQDEMDKQISLDQPGKFSENITKWFNQSGTRGKVVQKNKRTETNDTHSEFEDDSDDEDPFQFLDSPGQKCYGNSLHTGDQLRRNAKYKQSYVRPSKVHDDSKEQSNQMRQNTHWTCKFCTLENPLDQHICILCSKTNDELRTINLNKKGAEGNQKRPTFQLNEDKDDDRNRRPIRLNQNKRSDYWKCRHCTMRNPLNQYICHMCGKSNTELMAKFGFEKGAVQKHKHHKLTNNLNMDPQQLGRHDNNYAFTSRMHKKDVDVIQDVVEMKINQEQPPSLFQKMKLYIGNPSISPQVSKYEKNFKE